MKKLPYRHPVSVAAHRGDQAVAAENTREAFAAAIECKCDMIETDIHLTRDNVLILMHDHTVDRTTDGTGPISDYTYEELCRLNCNPNGAPSVVPTLDEFLALCAEHDMMVNLEIKEYCTPGNEDRCRFCVEQTLALVEKYNWVHSYPNAAAEVVALWFGEGDFTRTLEVCGMCGQDVDCNAAQIMTVWGTIFGLDAIPSYWKDPIGDKLDTYVRGMRVLSIQKLSERTANVARTLAE